MRKAKDAVCMKNNTPFLLDFYTENHYCEKYYLASVHPPQTLYTTLLYIAFLLFASV